MHAEIVTGRGPYILAGAVLAYDPTKQSACRNRKPLGRTNWRRDSPICDPSPLVQKTQGQPSLLSARTQVLDFDPTVRPFSAFASRIARFLAASNSRENVLAALSVCASGVPANEDFRNPAIVGPTCRESSCVRGTRSVDAEAFVRLISSSPLASFDPRRIADLISWRPISTARPAGDQRLFAVDFGQPGGGHRKLFAQVEHLAADLRVQRTVVGRL